MAFDKKVRADRLWMRTTQARADELTIFSTGETPVFFCPVIDEKGVLLSTCGKAIKAVCCFPGVQPALFFAC